MFDFDFTLLAVTSVHAIAYEEQSLALSIAENPVCLKSRNPLNSRDVVSVGDWENAFHEPRRFSLHPDLF
jgi:hypothetical protein